jgi:hypothetical protein
VSLPLVYDLNEAAIKLGKSERWLADKLRLHQFPGRKVGRTWKLTPDDLDEIIQLCAVSPGAASHSNAEAPEPASGVDAAQRPVPQASSMTRTTARRMRGDGQQSSRPACPTSLEGRRSE